MEKFNTEQFAQLKESFSVSDIKQILSHYNIVPVRELTNYIIFPTCCHNLYGGSPKLYYYTSSHSFHCYTECSTSFDIFALIQKLEYLRGNNINSYDALSLCCDILNKKVDNFSEQVDLNIPVLEPLPRIILQKEYNINIDSRFIFDKTALSVWEQEGISYETMEKYGIRYDPVDNCIIIPVYDEESRLVGVRGRYLNEDSDIKYRPIKYNKKFLTFESSAVLYGLDKNKEKIKECGKVILFEGEKSVMKMDSIYGEKNISLSTFGQNICMQHILLLMKYGVNEIILAYDSDFEPNASWDTKCALSKKYIKIADNLKKYFRVSIIMDWHKLLGYKDSPIDKGKEVFEALYEQRRYIR